MTSSQSIPMHFVLAILATLIITGLSTQHKTDWLSTPINALFTPLRKPFLATNQSIKRQGNFLNNLPHQQRIIDNLARQNAELSVNAQKVQELEKENLALKSLLSANISPNHNVISTKIIGLSRYAIINRGSNSGIAPEMPVVIDDILLGIVANVFPNSTQVRLLTDPDTSISTSTLSSDTGILTFSHNTLQLTQIPQKNQLKENQPVFTSGSTTIPNGLLIGKITQINSSDSSVYQTTTIEQASSITDHEYVFVILD